MYLIPVEIVAPHINPFFLTYRPNARLLGFMPCTNVGDELSWSQYYSVDTAKGRVVPVYYMPDMLFDSEPMGSVAGPALFFRGCDDGHTGLKFDSEALAMQWLDECRYADFEIMYRESCSGRGINLMYHN